MEKIITQAPIQVREDTISKHERLFPLLLSESLNRCDEFMDEQTKPRVDIWNTYGLKIERAFNKQSNSDRDGYIGRLIMQRYGILDSVYGIDPSIRTVLRDDDPDFCQIVTDEVGRLVVEGVMVVRECDFTECVDCDQIIAPAAAGIESCRVDSGHTLTIKKRNGLFLMASQKAKTMVTETANVSNLARRHLRSFVGNLPDQIQASKQREHGISLSEFGVDGFVLDPLIATSMLKKVLQERGDGELDTVVLGRDSFKNFVPYSILTGNGDGVKYIPHGLIPLYNHNGNSDSIPAFYFPFLPNYMSSKYNDLSSRQLESLNREFSKTRRKFNSTIYIMGQLRGQFTDEVGSNGIFNKVYSYIDQQELRTAMLQFRQILFQDISKNLVNEWRDKGLAPSTQLIDEMKGLYSILYGNY